MATPLRRPPTRGRRAGGAGEAAAAASRRLLLALAAPSLLVLALADNSSGGAPGVEANESSSTTAPGTTSTTALGTDATTSTAAAPLPNDAATSTTTRTAPNPGGFNGGVVGESLNETEDNGTSLAGSTRDNAGNSTVNSTALGPGMTLCDIDPPRPVAVGEPVMICIFISTNPPRKMVFRLLVEDHAELLLQGSEQAALKALQNRSASIYTWASKSHRESADPLICGGSTSSANDINRRGGMVSCPQIYATKTHMAHLLNLVINMQDGTISGFAWDNGCHGCGPEECMDSSMHVDLRSGKISPQIFEQGTCGADSTSCASGDFSCDLKIFVTWAGTDANGRHLASAGMRLSKFTGFTLGSVYRKMSSQYQSVKTSVGR